MREVVHSWNIFFLKDFRFPHNSFLGIKILIEV